MKKRLFSFAALAAGIVLLGWLFFRRASQHEISTVVPQPVVQSVTTASVVSNTPTVLPSVVAKTNVAPIQTRIGSKGIYLFKSTNYPPQTTEEKAMWDWYHAMEKADPHFKQKMPIEFYGKVVDQFGKPVPVATVVFQWTTVVGPVTNPEKRTSTGTDGRFELKDVQGKVLAVSVSKTGYDRTDDWIQNFDFADFFHDNFYVPDPDNPVIFHLHKTMEAEPLYVFSPYGDISVGGEPLVLSVEKGKVGSEGDLALSVALGTETNRYGSDFTVTIQGLNGAGFVFSDEEFMSQAPESGYQNTFSVTHKVNVPNYRPEQVLRFYVRTGTGKYATVGVRVNLWNNLKKADFDAGIHFNPSGSRNLEFDQNKWINR